MRENDTDMVCSKRGGDVKKHQFLVASPVGKRPLGRQKCREENNIKYRY
jgi:hypothetical protein